MSDVSWPRCQTEKCLSPGSSADRVGLTLSVEGSVHARRVLKQRLKCLYSLKSDAVLVVQVRMTRLGQVILRVVRIVRVPHPHKVWMPPEPMKAPFGCCTLAPVCKVSYRHTYICIYIYMHIYIRKSIMWNLVVPHLSKVSFFHLRTLSDDGITSRGAK